ncbi:hypothetical protein AHYW_000247 [Providencia manganoxydans]|uniref:hypothetical protein n=1 Tax=Providencia manganoxydans TaxID=2923283 RepID=UPI003B996D11
MTKQSAVVAKACQTCVIPEPCYQELKITRVSLDTDIHGEVLLHWRGETLPFRGETIIDEGDGVDIKVLLNGKEHPKDLHKAFFRAKRTFDTVSVNSPRTYHVSYDVLHDVSFFNMSKLMDMFLGALGPFSAFKSQEYQITAMNCNGDVPTWIFDVKPSIKIGFSLEFEYSFNSGERSANERRAEQAGNLIEESMKGKPGKNTLPKDFNRYRKGWTLNTVPFYKSEKKSFNIGLYCDIAGNEYTFTPYGISSEKKTLLDSLSGLAKIADIFNDFQDKFLCVSDKRVSEKNNQYPIFDFSFNPLKLGLTFYIDNIAKPGDAKLVCGLQGAPFFGGEIKIDVLQIAASYGGFLTKKLVNALQNALRKREKQAVSAEVSIDITLSCTINCFIGMAQFPQTNKTEFCIDGENSFKIKIEGAIKAHAEANVFSMTASFNFELKLATAASLELESHDNGVDLVVCHDGIVLGLGLSADIKKETDGQSPDKIGGASEPNEYEFYDIADPLKLKESDLRFNLIGEIKSVPKRQRQRIKQLIPAGANPGLKLKY